MSDVQNNQVYEIDKSQPFLSGNDDINNDNFYLSEIQPEDDVDVVLPVDEAQDNDLKDIPQNNNENEEINNNQNNNILRELSNIDLIKIINDLRLEIQDLRMKMEQMKINKLDSEIKSEGEIIHEAGPKDLNEDEVINELSFDDLNKNEKDQLLREVLESEKIDYNAYQDIINPIQISTGPYVLKKDGSIHYNYDYKSLNNLDNKLKSIYQTKLDIDSAVDKEKKAQEIEAAASQNDNFEEKQVERCSVRFEEIEKLSIKPKTLEELMERNRKINAEKRSISEFGYWWLRVVDKAYETGKIPYISTVILSSGKGAGKFLGKSCEKAYKTIKWTISGARKGFSVKIHDKAFFKQMESSINRKSDLVKLNKEKLVEAKYNLNTYYKSNKDTIEKYEVTTKILDKVDVLHSNHGVEEYKNNIHQVAVGLSKSSAYSERLLDILKSSINKDNKKIYDEMLYLFFNSNSSKEGYFQLKEYNELIHQNKEIIPNFNTKIKDKINILPFDMQYLFNAVDSLKKNNFDNLNTVYKGLVEHINKNVKNIIDLHEDSLEIKKDLKNTDKILKEKYNDIQITLEKHNNKVEFYVKEIENLEKNILNYNKKMLEKSKKKEEVTKSQDLDLSI